MSKLSAAASMGGTVSSKQKLIDKSMAERHERACSVRAQSKRFSARTAASSAVVNSFEGAQLGAALFSPSTTRTSLIELGRFAGLLARFAGLP